MVLVQKKIKRVTIRPNGTEEQIWPVQQGWQPGPNTLLYIPMDSVGGLTDQSNYHRTYSTSGLTSTTYGGVDCYQNSQGKINLGTSAYSWLIPAAHTFTMNMWVNNTSPGSQVMFQGAVNGEYFLSMGRRTSSGYLYISGGTPNNPGQRTMTTSTSAGNAWHLITLVVANSIASMYLDGTLLTDNSSVSATQRTNYSFGAWHTTAQNGIYIYAGRDGGDSWNGYVGHIIMEDIAWTQQEISDYYNQTKGNYGILDLNKNLNNNLNLNNQTPINLGEINSNSGSGDVLTI